MSDEKSTRILITITPHRTLERIERLMEEGCVIAKYALNAMGTASSEMISTLGLGSPDKIVTVSILPRVLANKMLQMLEMELRWTPVDRGIAFTLPVSSASNLLLTTIGAAMPEELLNQNEKGVIYMDERKHSLIGVMANRGYSAEIMTAARSAGATGGTVITSRKIVDEATTKYWEFGIQEEKEVILILTTEEDKLNIMKAISAQYGLRSEAQGILISLPVDNVMA